jgi:hypothetical protein
MRTLITFGQESSGTVLRGAIEGLTPALQGLYRLKLGCTTVTATGISSALGVAEAATAQIAQFSDLPSFDAPDAAQGANDVLLRLSGPRALAASLSKIPNSLPSKCDLPVGARRAVDSSAPTRPFFDHVEHGQRDRVREAHYDRHTRYSYSGIRLATVVRGGGEVRPHRESWQVTRSYMTSSGDGATVTSWRSQVTSAAPNGSLRSRSRCG